MTGMKELERDRKLFSEEEVPMDRSDVVDSAPNGFILHEDSSTSSEVEKEVPTSSLKVERADYSEPSVYNQESDFDNTSAADPVQDSIDSDVSFGNYVSR